MGGWVRIITISRGRQLTFPDTKDTRTIIWIHNTVMKYDVASATMVFNKTDNRRFVAPEYANQRIRRKAERSDTISRDRLATVASEVTHRIQHQLRGEQSGE